MILGKSAFLYSQTRRELFGKVDKDGVGRDRERRIELWSEEETGGRMWCLDRKVEGMKTKSMMDGEPECE